jgi:hypothetical protein
LSRLIAPTRSTQESLTTSSMLTTMRNSHPEASQRQEPTLTLRPRRRTHCTCHRIFSRGSAYGKTPSLPTSRQGKRHTSRRTREKSFIARAFVATGRGQGCPSWMFTVWKRHSYTFSFSSRPASGAVTSITKARVAFLDSTALASCQSLHCCGKHSELRNGHSRIAALCSAR